MCSLFADTSGLCEKQLDCLTLTRPEMSQQSVSSIDVSLSVKYGRVLYCLYEVERSDLWYMTPF